MSLYDSITNLISRANDALVFDADNIINLRQFVVGALADFYTLRERASTPQAQEIPNEPVPYAPPSPSVRKRFAVIMPGTGQLVSENVRADRVVIYIDGLFTESKILAIKRIRQSDGIGLKDAKDIVDSLVNYAPVLKGFGAVEV